MAGSRQRRTFPLKLEADAHQRAKSAVLPNLVSGDSPPAVDTQTGDP